MATMAFIDFAKVLATSPPEGFPPAQASLGASEEVQLLLFAPILVAFAAAVRSVDEGKEADRKAETDSVQLFKVDAVAFRLATASVGFVISSMIAAISKVLPSSPRGGFPTSDAALQVPEETQLLLISSLLFVFSGMIKDAVDNEQQVQAESNKSSHVDVLRAHVIALRLSIAAGVCGLLKTITGPSLAMMSSTCIDLIKALPASPRKGFTAVGPAPDVPMGIQLLAASFLLVVFGALVKSAAEETEQSESDGKSKSPVELVRIPAMALRLGTAVGFFGFIQVAQEMPEFVGSLASSELTIKFVLLLAGTALVLNGQLHSVSMDDAKKKA